MVNKILIAAVIALGLIILGLSVERTINKRDIEVKSAQIDKLQTENAMTHAINGRMKFENRRLKKMMLIKEQIAADNRKHQQELQRQNNELASNLIEVMNKNEEIKKLSNSDLGPDVIKQLWLSESGLRYKDGVCETIGGVFAGDACTKDFGLHRLRVVKLAEFAIDTQTALMSCNLDKRSTREEIAGFDA